MLKVFITHMYEDNNYELAKQLKEIIIKYGKGKFKPIIAEEELIPLESLPNKFADMIDDCDIFIPLITEKAYNKNVIWVQQEIGYAFSCKRKLGIQIIPVVEKREIIKKGFFNRQTDIPFSLSDIKSEGEYSNEELWKILFKKVVNHMLQTIPDPFSVEFIQIVEKPFTDKDSIRLDIQGYVENRRRRKQLDLVFGFIVAHGIIKNIRSYSDDYDFHGLVSIPKRFQESIKDKGKIYRTVIEKIYPFDFWNIGFYVDIKSIEWDNYGLPIGIYLLNDGETYLWNPIIIKKENKFLFHNNMPKLLNLGDEIIINPERKAKLLGLV